MKLHIFKNKFFINFFFFLKFNYIYYFILNNIKCNFFNIITNFLSFNVFFYFFNIYFILFSKKYFKYKNKSLLTNFYYNFSLIINFYYLHYKFYKFFTFVGLGFKKRLFPTFLKNRFFLYFGHRHWIVFLIPKKFFFFYLIKRKSIILFSKIKSLLQIFLSNFKSFCQENFFKLKGVLDTRLKKKWYFMRRVKIKGLKIKLSKKQKIL